MLGVTSVDSCASNDVCAPGTVFAIRVNKEETYKFYVLNDDGEKVTMIMSDNIGNNVE